MYNKEEYQSLILAALLHDIGKFYQRTKVDLNEEDRKLMTSCCPVYKGDYRRQHVLYSGRFIREKFNNRFPLIENLVLYHHRPESANVEYRRLVKIIALADWLSSGERRDREDVAEGEVSEEPLISIFSTLFPNERNTQYKFIPLLPLTNDLAPLFPKDNKEDALHSNSYPSLWEAFSDEVKNLKDESDLHSLIIKFQSILQKFAFTIPSAAYTDRPDIALYHHLKMTAAIAACLYQLNIKEDETDEIFDAIKNMDYDGLSGCPCILLACDISGIQDFIYSVTSEKALKSLKGRSFYLQLISESLARSITNLFDLPLCNIIFIGGGNLYLLLPNTENVAPKIKALKESLNTNLLYAHRGKLTVNIAYERLKYSDFLEKNFGITWSNLKGILAKEKRKKFSDILNDQKKLESILGPYDLGGESRVCEICGEELEGEWDICSMCNSFAELAYDLTRARYLQIINTKPKEIKERVRDCNKLIESIGTKYVLLRDPTTGDNVYLINNVNFLSEKSRFTGFYFIARNAPGTGEQIKTLEEIADDATGVKKWGVLRADVDNLGKIFAYGLGEKDRTISRVAMLSENLGMFFNVQVEKIANESVYKDKIYVVYSGGDDLFIIGSWSVLPDFALRLYEDFRKYTANSLTLSASIFIAPSKKFPVYQSAAQAKDDLDLAKTNDKNKLTFLEKPIPWDVLSDLKKIKDKITFLLDEKGPNLPRSLLQILNFGWMESQKFRKGEVQMQRIWRFLYAMRRLKERHNNYKVQIDELEKAIIIDEQKIFRDYLEVPVRWAELLTRKEV